MKVFRTSPAAAFLLLALATPSVAEGLKDRYPRRVPNPPPTEIVYQPTVNWSGLYFGGSLGFALANTDHYYDRQNGKNDHGQVWLDSSGYQIAGHIGYNYMLPSLWVIGVEGELGWLGIDNERIVIKDDDVLRLNSGFFGTLRGRVGYAMGRFLPYVTAGVAFVDIENAGGNPNNNNRFLTVSEIRPGFAVGAGAEYAFSPHLTARLEYLYIDTMSYEVRNLENEMMKFDNNFHLIRAGLNFKF